MHQFAPGPKARHTIATIGGAGAGNAPPPAPPPPIPPAHDDPDPTYDTLTDLFLGDGCLAPAHSAPATSLPFQASEPAPGLLIEALVLGHLPVLASAWVGQYAKHIAQTTGRPVALLRVRAGSVALDLVGGVSGTSPSSREPLSTLDDALREGTAHTGRWVLSVEATNEPRVAGMLGSRGIDTLTLLTGADEAAVVACYRTIKSLLGKTHGSEDPDDAAPANIQLGVMGAVPERAQEAGVKLAHAAETFLGQRPRVVACVSKIGGSPSRPLYRGSDERTVEELVAMIRGLPATQRPRTATVQPEARLPAKTVFSRQPAPAHGRLSVASQSTPANGRGGLPGPELRAPMERESLAAHLPGLTAITFRCPYVSRVELAKSSDGRLHLLACVEHGSGLGSAAAHLAGAAAWARVHSDLLMAACPGLSLDLGMAAPICHVFADHAPDARSLLDSEIRVHLLAEAKVSPGGPVVCVDLN